MRLKLTKTTRNKVVTLELETLDFTQAENEMLDQLGEPIIKFDKSYGNHVVKFSKKIRSNFRVRIKFDGNLDSTTDVTANYIESFEEELKTKLSDAMSNLLNDYNEELAPAQELIDIKY